MATLTLPGFVNAHSHAFQRALRGRTEGADFWGWRESMLDVAGGLSPDQVRSGYVQVYREMLAAGYMVVGEFHYLGLAEAHAAVEAAAEAGIEMVLLLSAYGRGGHGCPACSTGHVGATVTWPVMPPVVAAARTEISAASI